MIDVTKYKTLRNSKKILDINVLRNPDTSEFYIVALVEQKGVLVYRNSPYWFDDGTISPLDLMEDGAKKFLVTDHDQRIISHYLLSEAEIEERNVKSMNLFVTESVHE